MGITAKRWTVVAGLLGSAGALIGVAPAAGSVPAPAVALPRSDSGAALEAFGATSAGDVFYNVGEADPKGRVRHADGSVTKLTVTLAGQGEVGPDDRLWLPIPGGLRTVAADGTIEGHPIPHVGGPTPYTVVVRAGVDGRIWFLDGARNAVGAMATDGSGAIEWPVPGTRSMRVLSEGTDGRMWFARVTGELYAITTTGTLTSYPEIAGSDSYHVPDAMAANPSGLYVYFGSSSKLLRISESGVASPVHLPIAFASSGPVESGGWIFAGTTSISPSGRIGQYAFQIDFDGFSSAYSAYPGSTTYAPSRAGGFVGTIGGTLVSYPNPDIPENVKVSASLREVKGVKYIHVVASVRTPGGAARSGSYEVRIRWTRYIPDNGFQPISSQSRHAGNISVSGGTGSVDVPVTSSLVAGTPDGGLDHGNCCSVYLQKSPTPLGAGLASYGASATDGFVYSGTVLAPSTTTAWLDRMNGRALARPMDTYGLVYWAGRLTSGTPRVTVTKSVVYSTGWRRQRVTSAYRRWLGRVPTSSELEYWQAWLQTHTTSDVDLRLAATTAGRDAGGTSNAKRAKHLAGALKLASASAATFEDQLDAGTPWATLVRTAYFGNAAAQRRMTDLAPRSSFTPSLESLVAEFRAAKDERGPLAKALATMP